MSFNNYGSNIYNHPNNYSNNYPYDNRNYAQASVTKQEIAQIQDLELSIDTMCRVLTLGEKYALGQNVNFGAYNLSSATGDDLLRLFVIAILSIVLSSSTIYVSFCFSLSLLFKLFFVIKLEISFLNSSL